MKTILLAILVLVISGCSSFNSVQKSEKSVSANHGSVYYRGGRIPAHLWP